MLKNFIYKILLEISRIIIPIITIPYIYKKFNIEIIGNIEYSQSIMEYFMIFAGYGIYNYGLRELSYLKKTKYKKNVLYSELLIISIIVNIICSILYFGYIFLEINGDKTFRIFLFLNSIQIISMIFKVDWVNESFEDYKFISIRSCITRILNLILVLLIIKGENDYYKYVFLINIFVLINNLLSFKHITKYVKFIKRNLNIKKHFWALTLIFIVNNINVLYTQLDRFLLGKEEKLKELAYYGLGNRIIGIIVVMMLAIISVNISKLSYFLSQKNKFEYERLMNKLLNYVYIIIIPTVIGMIIYSKEIFMLLGGEIYANNNNILKIFSIRVIIMVLGNLLMYSGLYLNKKEKIILKIHLFCGGLNVVFKYLLIHFHYFNGNSAILTTMIVEIIIIILAFYELKIKEKIKIELLKLDYLKYILIAFQFYLIKLLILRYINNVYVQIFYGVIICSSIYFILLFISKDKCLVEVMNKIDMKKYISRRK